MQKLSHRNQPTQSGFTIVELMITTLVFSVILIIITVGVVTFTRSYYKGINSSTTQDTARSVIDTVSQALQFGGSGLGCTNIGATSGNVQIGDQEFFYNLNKQATGSGTYALYQTPANANCSITTPDLSDVKGKELLSPHTRLVDFGVVAIGANGLYSVTVSIAYGDDDLLCSPTVVAGKCTTNNPANWLSTYTTGAVTDLRCKSQTGSQFCAVSALSTTVQTRVGGGS